MFLGMVFIGLSVLTVGTVILYIRCPKDDNDVIYKEPASMAEPDKPARLAPIAKCSFCGWEIDTGRDKVCPNCGLDYEKDDWNSGFGEDLPAKKRPWVAKGFRERLFKSMIVFFILDFLFIGSMICVATGVIGTHYRRNEELNDSGYEWYKPVGYRINGDGVIYDEGGIKITVSGIYQVPSLDPENDSWPAGNVKVGLLVENYSGKNVEIYASCNSINGVSGSTSYIFMGGNFRKNTTTQVYETVYDIPGNDIGTMVFDGVTVFSLKYELLAESETPVFITTTAEVTVPEFDLSDYHPIFENDEFVIYACKYTDQFHDGYKLYMENRTDTTYTVDIDGMTIDGKGVTGEGIYGSLIPAGNVMTTSQIYSYNSTYNEGTPYNREVMLSLYFKSLDETADNFSTGYMPLN